MLLLLPLCSAIGPETESDLTTLINTLTLEQKVGQMTNLAIAPLVNSSSSEVLDGPALSAFLRYGIGSAHGTWSASRDSEPHEIISWVGVLNRLHDYVQNTTTRIPLLFGISSVHGAGFVEHADLFPHQINVAATFNTYLAERIAAGGGYDTRCAGIHQTFSPGCAARAGGGSAAAWGGQWHTFGEDPILSAEMASAYVRGYQGGTDFAIDQQHVAATATHFIGSPLSGKDGGPAVLDDAALREYHLPAFERAVQAGVSAVMLSSRLVNGVPVHADRDLVTNLLKEELGFDGFVLSDIGGVYGLFARHAAAASRKDAVRLAVNAGVDVVVTDDLEFCDYLVALVREGAVPLARVDDAVRRVLRAKLRLNLWNRPILYGDYSQFATRRELAQETARRSMVLLKNENATLPLRRGQRILVTGPNADSIRALNGGYSYSLQGDLAPLFSSSPTIQEALRDFNGENFTAFVPGVSYNESGTADFDDRLDAAVAAAKAADVVVCAIGENSYAGASGDVRDLEISPRQRNLVRRLATAGKPIVLVLNEGRPRLITGIAGFASAIVDVMLPGNSGAEALAGLLFGVSNFVGKLPFSYPKYKHNLITYIHKHGEIPYPHEGDASFIYDSAYDPMWRFGHGLSYTTFDYRGLNVSEAVWDVRKSRELNVFVTVRNSGKRAGIETVLLYSSDLYATLAPDVKRLRKWASVDLDAGSEAVVNFTLTPEDLSFVNSEKRRVTEPGHFTLSTGNLTVRFEIV
jgi:beta-glucosidase